jgi:hypothetical protein
VVLESFTKHVLAFILIDSRTTDPKLGLLVISYQDCKLETTVTMKISSLFVGLAEYSAISVEGVNTGNPSRHALCFPSIN